MIAAPPDVQLRTRYQAVRKHSEYLCSPLQAEDYVPQPVIDVSPPKWHLAHTTWFFETFVLKPYLEGYSLYNARWPFLFNSYYEGAGDRMFRGHRGNMTRPTTEEIYAYRTAVDAAMDKLFEGRVSEECATVIELGLQHEQQHQELLLYDIKYILGHNPLMPTYTQKALPHDSPKDDAPLTTNYLEVPEGIYEIGHADDGFHFDNEEGRHRVFLERFRVLDRLVTVGEFAEFMEAGGYRDANLWLSEGIAWVRDNEIEKPYYWFKRDGEWFQYTLRGLQPLDLRAPMTHVNYFEADAFAKWSGKRLPTEFEWEVACRTFEPEVPEVANFVETEAYHPRYRRAGSHQFFGDGWEWTQSAYLPYPGYQAPPGALGEYNGKWMVNQMVLRGGSCATPRDHIRLTYRNFFHPHLQWHFTAIRLAEHF